MASRKTNNLTWLEHSVIGFWGSPNANKTSVNDFYKSYLRNKWAKHDIYAIKIIESSEKASYKIIKKLFERLNNGK